MADPFTFTPVYRSGGADPDSGSDSDDPEEDAYLLGLIPRPKAKRGRGRPKKNLVVPVNEVEAEEHVEAAKRPAPDSPAVNARSSRRRKTAHASPVNHAADPEAVVPVEAAQEEDDDDDFLDLDTCGNSEEDRRIAALIEESRRKREALNKKVRQEIHVVPDALPAIPAEPAYVPRAERRRRQEAQASSTPAAAIPAAPPPPPAAEAAPLSAGPRVSLCLRLSTDQSKHRVQVGVTELLRKLVPILSDSTGLHEKDFHLHFEGERLDLALTPQALDLEDDDLVDVVVRAGAKPKEPSPRVTLRCHFSHSKQVQKYKIRVQDPFSKLMAVVTQHTGASKVLLSVKGEALRGDETPAGRELQDGDLLDAELEFNELLPAAPATILIKITVNKTNKKTKIRTTDPLSVVRDAFCAVLSIPKDSAEFYLKDSASPLDLDKNAGENGLKENDTLVLVVAGKNEEG
mmetsp:Transcript_7308/g.21051  ORF Transcript_7308/g.21051 Transcript_7308/m.21051 type:complete len:460 (-) Transcript_7308:131-1510(-)